MKKFSTLLVVVATAILLPTSSFATKEAAKHEARGKSADVEPHLRKHPVLKPYVDRYGWTKAVNWQGSGCAPDGNLLSPDQKSSLHCRDYQGNDGNLWRVQFDFKDSNKVTYVYRVDNGKPHAVVTVKNETVIADSTGVQSNPTQDAKDPTAIAQKVDPAKELGKTLGGLIKKLPK